jgi:hypothetical protein
MVHKIAQERCIGLTEARLLISQMSFKQYRDLSEASADIVPPSGKPLSPTGPGGAPPAAANPPGQQSQPAATAPAPAAPATPQGKADPRGVQVRNPVTGKMEWMQPSNAMAGKVPGQPAQPGMPPASAQQMAEDKDLARMRQLAGIKEDGSCGGTGAGAIAIAPMPMGGVKRRQPTNEQQPKEYTAKEAPKTIVGDTKPGQASGELSANLAVRGKKSASRIHNGFKK